MAVKRFASMAKAILTHKPASIYDDLPEVRYHFPRTYLRQVEAAVGDFVIYYEPGRTGLGDTDRTGRRSYIAVAQVQAVEADPDRADHFYALMVPGSYLAFDRPVPFFEGEHFYERILMREDGKVSKGAFGRAVRSLPEDEFAAILAAGFRRELDYPESDWDLPEPGTPAGVPSIADLATHYELAEPEATFERPIVERVLSRPVRDAAFKRVVREAYGATCAVTGLSLTNGRGRPEVQAAHIRPVEHQGPDSVRNGVALSGTVHWLFDRGLISIGPPPGYEVLVGRKGLPDAMQGLVNADRRLRVPPSPLLRPAEVFLEFHRREVFDRAG
jgi:putative restriction endonuclease